MAIRERLSGNEAIAIAMRQINPDVVAAFPITPSTEIPQYFSSFVANGQVDSVFVPVESEHSAMSATIAASAAGARAMTATSSCGLALMWEMLYIAASARLPLALALVNRTLSGPININCDHSDAMGARDAGWIQLFSENNQEAYDNMLMAFKISEHPSVMTPIMVCQDGFITSHGVENIELLEDEIVKEFVGDYHPVHYLLNKDEPLAVGPYANPPFIMEAKRSCLQGLMNSKQVMLDVAEDFAKLTGRKYSFFEEYCMEDADYVMVIMGSAAGTAKDTVDALRAKGIKAGLLKVRMFRPFPGEQMAAALKNAKVIAVMDRTESFNTVNGPLGADVKTVLYDNKSDALIVNYAYGLAGRDVTVESLTSVYEDMLQIEKDGCVGETYRYLSLRD